MKLTIIIVSWNVKDDLVNCLRSIEEHQPSVPFEIIVVDNASSDRTVETVKKNFPNVTVIANSENKGFAAANNQAIKIAKGQYLLLLNPDTIVHKNTLDSLIKVLDENPQAAACGPKILDANGEYCPSIGYIPTFRSLLYHWTFLRYLGIFRNHYKQLKRTHLSYDNIADVEQLSGSVLLLRRPVMKEIGLFDENFFMYYEDVDLCLRIRNAGWKIIFVPDAVITHIGGKSTEQVSEKKKFFLYSSALIFFRKHRGKFPTFLFSVVFKSGTIIKEIIIILSAIFVGLFYYFSDNRIKQKDIFEKAKKSAEFLHRYSLKFLFKS